MLENNKGEPTLSTVAKFTESYMCLSACCLFWLPIGMNWVKSTSTSPIS
jgi:hypothetical protein